MLEQRLDVNVAGCIVPLTDTVKLLGATIDRHLTFDSHVQNVCKSAYYHIRALKLIPFHRQGVNGCICVGGFATRLRQLGTVQHQFSEHVETTASSELTCSCIVTYAKRVEPVLHQLHWLPINYTVSTTRLRHWRIKYTVNGKSSIPTSISQ